MEAFITKIRETSDKRNRPLHMLYIFACTGFPFSYTYTKAPTHGHWFLEEDLPVPPFLDRKPNEDWTELS
jgi:hypothetical protein